MYPDVLLTITLVITELLFLIDRVAHRICPGFCFSYLVVGSMPSAMVSTILQKNHQPLAAMPSKNLDFAGFPPPFWKLMSGAILYAQHSSPWLMFSFCFEGLQIFDSSVYWATQRNNNKISVNASRQENSSTRKLGNCENRMWNVSFR